MKNEALETLIANIKQAIWRREPVIIAGGVFKPDELQLLVDLYEASK